MAGNKAGLMPRKPSRRPATASARVDQHPSSNEMKSIRSSLNGRSSKMASTSMGNEQLRQYMDQMGIPFPTQQKEMEEEGESQFQTTSSSAHPIKVKQDSFGSHRRSVSFLELVDRNSRGPINSPDSTLEEVSKVVPPVEEHIPKLEAGSLVNSAEPNTHSVLSQAFARISELESSLEYYERACVDATFDSDFWQNEYNRLHDVMRIAEQKQEQMMLYIRKLESRLKTDEKKTGQGDSIKSNKKTEPTSSASTVTIPTRRSSASTITIPIPIKGDVNSHSMLEIASSSASVTTIEEDSSALLPFESHLNTMKQLKRVTSSSTMKSKEIFALDQTISASSASTMTQRKQANGSSTYNPLIAPIMQNQLKSLEVSNWDQEKRNVISKWVETAQVSNEDKQKSKRITTIERSLKEASNIQNANELFYKGWTIDSTPQEDEGGDGTLLTSPRREEDVRGRHPFSISRSDPALKARWADVGSKLGLDQEQNEAQAYAGLQAHSRWRVWKVHMGK